MTSFFLILVAVVLFGCVILNQASNKYGVPVLLAFILFGLFTSSELFHLDIGNKVPVEKLCSIGLVFIMFYGGFGTSWKTAKGTVIESALLSTLGVAITAALTGTFCHFVLKWNWIESLLLGSVISSTDAATVFSILRGKKLGLKNHTAPILEMESGSNDPMSYLLTIMMLSLVGGSTSGWKLTGIFFAQIIIGVLSGVLIGFSVLRYIRKIGFSSSGFSQLFFFAVALISYALPDVLGGNGYLSAYIAGIMLGNASFHGKKEVILFMDGITTLMQVLIFFSLGLLATPASIVRVILPSLAIFAFILLISRPIAVAAILAPFGKYKLGQRLLISFSGLRGASSIVFAIVATIVATNLENDIFNIVFCVVLLSISIQGFLLPKMAKALEQIDEDTDVMQTFTDFGENTDLQFSSLLINSSSDWCGKKVSDLKLPDNILLVRIKRENGERITPKGDTEIIDGDKVIYCSTVYHGPGEARLIEREVSSGGKYDGKKVSELNFSADEQLLLIRRDSRNIIPHGNTVLKSGDVIFINKL